MDQGALRTPLTQWHRDNGAKMTDFAGFDMPLAYPAGTKAEHQLTRRSAALFDISHMTRFTVRGPQAAAFLARVFSADLSSIGPGMSAYSLMLAEDGGILDDVFVYNRPWPFEDWLIVANAANHSQDWAWLREQSTSYEVDLVNQSSKTAMIALQGPKALELLFGSDPAPWPRFGCGPVSVFGSEVFAARTGYTGEDGLELICSNESALTLWEGLLARAVEWAIELGAAGLGARDSLRSEVCFALYGHEMDRSTIPQESGLAWVCRKEGGFIGYEAMNARAQAKPVYRLVGIELAQKAVPRHGYELFILENSTDYRPIGSVTSGLISPTLGKPVALARVLFDHRKIGTQLFVDIRGRKIPALVVKRPFYTPAYQTEQ